MPAPADGMCENAAALATASQIGRSRVESGRGGRAARLFFNPCSPQDQKPKVAGNWQLSSHHFLRQTLFAGFLAVQVLDFSCIHFQRCVSLFRLCCSLRKAKVSAREPWTRAELPLSLLVTSYQAAPTVSILLW